MFRRHSKYGFIWIGLLILTFIVMFVGQSFHSRGLIFNETLTATARVVEFQPENHSTVYYEYDAKGSSYRGAGSAEGYVMGDDISIRFSNEKPWLSEISDNLFTPRELFIFCLLGSLFLSSFGTLAFFVNGLLTRKLSKVPLE